MHILVLNGSPRPNGNTKGMVEAFRDGAVSVGHHVDVIDVCRLIISGCLACEYCHTKGRGACVQKDDKQQIYDLLKEAERLVLASPIFYHGVTGQQNASFLISSSMSAPQLLQMSQPSLRYSLTSTPAGRMIFWW